jgi:hypothetical protein
MRDRHASQANGSKETMNSPQPRSAARFDGRAKRWNSDRTRERPNGLQNAQRSYQRYVELAETEIRAGDIVAAKNYYQHAEHYFRSMSPIPEAS